MSDEHIVARFYDHPRLNKAESREKKMRVFETVLMCELRNRGEKSESYSELVRCADQDRTEEFKARFPNAWARYKGEGAVVSGTMISVLGLEVGELAMLEGLDVRTVEELAALNDATVMKIRGGQAMKAKAATFLENQEAAKVGNVMDMMAEMREQLAALKAENAALKTETLPKRRARVKEEDGNADAPATV